MQHIWRKGCWERGTSSYGTFSLCQSHCFEMLQSQFEKGYVMNFLSNKNRKHWQVTALSKVRICWLSDELEHHYEYLTEILVGLFYHLVQIIWAGVKKVITHGYRSEHLYCDPWGETVLVWSQTNSGVVSLWWEYDLTSIPLKHQVYSRQVLFV